MSENEYQQSLNQNQYCRFRNNNQSTLNMFKILKGDTDLK